MTTVEFKDLAIGDKFTHANGKVYTKIEPRRNCCNKFNAQHTKNKQLITVNDFMKVTKVEESNEQPT